MAGAVHERRGEQRLQAARSLGHDAVEHGEDVGALVALLAGCGGEEQSELRGELQALTKDLRGRVDPLPQVRSYEPVPAFNAPSTFLSASFCSTRRRTSSATGPVPAISAGRSSGVKNAIMLFHVPWMSG